MNTNFNDIDIHKVTPSQPAESTSTWLTPEQIPVKPIYTKDDQEGMEHLGYAAGLPPYLSGTNGVRYAMHSWPIRLYASFSTD